MTRLGVYGTLRKGMGNHYLLEGFKYIETIQVPGWMMITFASTIPTILYTGDKNESVTLEVYEVDDHTLRDIDQLEGYRGEGMDNWYTRSEVCDGEDGPIFAYTWQEHVIKGGDYVSWRKER